VSESAAGLNDARPKLTKVLPTPKGGSIVLEHRDRLPPVGYGSIAARLAQHGRRGEARSPGGETFSPRDSGDGVVQECVALLTRRAARSYGRRTSTRRAERIRACRACGACVLHRESEDT
jgi:predicted site-specific integrase-resolvase